MKQAQLPPWLRDAEVAGDIFGTELLLECSLQHVGCHEQQGTVAADTG